MATTSSPATDGQNQPASQEKPARPARAKEMSRTKTMVGPRLADFTAAMGWERGAFAAETGDQGKNRQGDAAGRQKPPDGFLFLVYIWC